MLTLRAQSQQHIRYTEPQLDKVEPIKHALGHEPWFLGSCSFKDEGCEGGGLDPDLRSIPVSFPQDQDIQAI